MAGHRHRPARRTAPAPPPPPPPESDDSRVFLDLLWIAFTVCVVVVVGKSIACSTNQEIIDFVEGETFFLALSLFVICLSLITLYGYVFYLDKRYEVLVDLALDYVIAAQNQVRQLRGSFFWLRNAMAFFQPTPRNFALLNRGFRSFFLFGIMLLASLTGSLMCTNKEAYAETTSVNFVILGLYYTFVYSPHETRFEMIIAHVGYTFLHSGGVLAYHNFDQIGYILINLGVSLFILCIVWNFVNVPRNQEQRRR